MVNGQHVVVNPGESLVLAHSAINHKGTDGSTGTVDLSGANFEFYVQYIENGKDYTMTTDNPEVPNMIIDYSANQAFNWGYNGATPIMLVRLDDATKAAILADKVNLTMPLSWGYMHLEQSTEPGEHEGEFLPTQYYSYYEIDNRPLNLFSQLTASKYGNITEQLNYSAILGTTLNYTKNVGDGVISDPLRPPYADKAYIRPRRNSDIPALANHAGYAELKHPVDTKPTKDDFLSKTRYEFGSIRQPMNSSRVVKKGLEYRLHIPRIEPIRTQVEINGAYYNTMYTNGIPVMYAPPQMVAGESFPYMGIFSNPEKSYRKSFNTNFWLNTHLPKLKLIFTNFIQVIWFERARIGREASDYPEHYMDKQGNIYPLTDEAMLADNTLQSLHRQYTEARYNELRKPVSLRMNLKLTKEFSDWVKFSFFADNILQISPKYKNNYEQTVRDWYRPFFGAELTINIH